MAKKAAKVRSVEEISQQFWDVMHFYDQGGTYSSFNNEKLGWRENCSLGQRLEELLDEWEIASPQNWQDVASQEINKANWDKLTLEAAKLFAIKGLLNQELSWKNALILACKHADRELLELLAPPVAISVPAKKPDNSGAEAKMLAGVMSGSTPLPPDVLEVAAKHSVVGIIKWLLAEQKFPPADALPHAIPGSGDSRRVGEICEILLQHGVQISDSAAVCAQLQNATDRYKFFNLADVLPPLLTMGLNLNELDPDENMPMLFAGQKNLAKGIRWASAGTGSSLGLLSDFSRNDWSLVDSGCCLPASALNRFTKNDFEEVQTYLPIAHRVLGPNSPNNGSLSIEPKAIPLFLQRMQPEALICRCTAFNLMDRDVFDAILAAENQKRERNQEPPLLMEQLFAQLPPFLKGHERLATIREALERREVADWIPNLLKTTRPEKIVRQCVELDLMNQQVFAYIVEAENQQRAKGGDTPLTMEQLFALLPPALQNHERMLSVRQMLQHRKAAETPGLGDMRDKAGKKPRVE